MIVSIFSSSQAPAAFPGRGHRQGFARAIGEAGESTDSLCPRLTDIKLRDVLVLFRCPGALARIIIIFPVCTISCVWVFIRFLFCITNLHHCHWKRFRYPIHEPHHHRLASGKQEKGENRKNHKMFGRGRKQSVSQASVKSVKPVPPPTASVRDSGVSKRRPSVASTRRRGSVATSSNTLVDPSGRWVSSTLDASI